MYFNEGLITKQDPQTENRNLFYAEYLTLGGVDQGFNSFMNAKKLPIGLYLRSSIHTTRTVSQDEILGWMVSSKILKTNHRLEIWDTLKANLGAYPAVVHNWTDRLPYNLGNYYVWGKLANKSWTSIFAPLYGVNLLINSFKEKGNTSSKILNWLELSNIDAPLFKWFFEKRMEAMYGKDWLKIIMGIYFNGEDRNFPILKELYK
jgi:hypothetical protein